MLTIAIKSDKRLSLANAVESTNLAMLFKEKDKKAYKTLSKSDFHSRIAGTLQIVVCPEVEGESEEEKHRSTSKPTRRSKAPPCPPFEISSMFPSFLFLFSIHLIPFIYFYLFVLFYSTLTISTTNASLGDGLQVIFYVTKKNMGSFLDGEVVEIFKDVFVSKKKGGKRHM